VEDQVDHSLRTLILRIESASRFRLRTVVDAVSAALQGRVGQLEATVEVDVHRRATRARRLRSQRTHRAELRRATLPIPSAPRLRGSNDVIAVAWELLLRGLLSLLEKEYCKGLLRDIYTVTVCRGLPIGVLGCTRGSAQGGRSRQLDGPAHSSCDTGLR